MNLQYLFTQEKQIENVNMLFFIFVSYIKHLFSHWFAYDWEGNLFVGETEMLSIIDKVHFKDEKSCLLFLFFLQLQVKKNAQFVYTNAATLWQFTLVCCGRTRANLSNYRLHMGEWHSSNVTQNTNKLCRSKNRRAIYYWSIKSPLYFRSAKYTSLIEFTCKIYLFLHIKTGPCVV